MADNSKLIRHIGDPHATVSMADRMKAADALEAADQRIAELEQRLEVYDTDGNPVPDDCDGIACRDETIRLQDERIASLKEDKERLRAVVDAAKDMEPDWGPISPALEQALAAVEKGQAND